MADPVPSSWTLRVALRDGSPVLLRLITPADSDQLADGYRQLTPESRFARFHTSSPRLSDSQLRYLSEVDQEEHVAIAAVRGDELPEKGLGTARYVRLKDHPGVAEAAVTVLDEYQHKGVGTLLLAGLAKIAIDAGIASFRNYVLVDNTPMLALFEQLGGQAEIEAPGLARVDLCLSSDPNELLDTPAGRVFKAVSQGWVEPADTFPAVFGTREPRPADDESGRERGELRRWLNSVMAEDEGR